MPMEKIAEAAIKIGDDIYVGPTHFAVMQKVIRLPGIDPAKAAQMLLNGVDGFVTSTGRFVQQDETAVIAKAAGQPLLFGSLVDQLPVGVARRAGEDVFTDI